MLGAPSKYLSKNDPNICKVAVSQKSNMDFLRNVASDKCALQEPEEQISKYFGMKIYNYSETYYFVELQSDHITVLGKNYS